MVKPKLIMERAVRTQAMSVRSAAIRVRSRAKMSVILSSVSPIFFLLHGIATG
jgi:hypothetical protein